MTTRVSFDRAADYYDATRSLPDAAQGVVADVLAAELRGRGRCLELGTGTGRTSLPLHERGVRIVGTDIAPAMLRRLVDNAGGVLPFPVVLGDATQLPVRTGAFGAVFACHVLHLIPAWRRAVDEALRVVRADGVLLVDFGGGTRAPWSDESDTILRRHGIVRRRPGVSSAEIVASHLASPPRTLAPVDLVVTRTLAQDLADWEAQIHAWTWAYSPSQMHEACDDVRRWARKSGLAADEPVELDRRIQWYAFDQPGRGGRRARS
jgi:ubiquinone/menaquinone biosynthesis C-methylase UbiE